MNLILDHTVQEGLMRLAAFVLLGMLIRFLSLKFPMQGYDNAKIEPFDLKFTLVALSVAIAVEELINPFLLEALLHCSTWPQQAVAWVDQGGTGLQILVYLALTDLLGYAVHRLMHTPWIWRIHAFHHSVRSLNWISGVRGSPWHIVLILLPGTLMSSLLLLPKNPTAFAVIMLIDIASQHLNHSNVRLPFASKLEWILVTPQMHFIHHNIDERYGKCNFGFYFSFWDRVFGTYVNAQNVSTKGQLGLAEDYSTSSLLWGIHLKKRS